jgi:hypothetical protein
METSRGTDRGHSAATSALREPDVGAIELVTLDQPLTPSASPGHPARLHWRSLSDGILICFLSAAPSLFAGFILRDQREEVWTLMLLVAAAGFLVGGAIAGRHRRAARGAIAQGVVCGFLTATVIVVANAMRTAVLGNGISTHTLVLWLGVEAGAVIIAAIGALIGRHRHLRARRRIAALN